MNAENARNDANLEEKGWPAVGFDRRLYLNAEGLADSNLRQTGGGSFQANPARVDQVDAWVPDCRSPTDWANIRRLRGAVRDDVFVGVSGFFFGDLDAFANIFTRRPIKDRAQDCHHHFHDFEDEGDECAGGLGRDGRDDVVQLVHRCLQ